jgi:O-antigen ligase
MFTYAVLALGFIIGLWLVFAKERWYPAFYIIYSIPVASEILNTYFSRLESSDAEGIGGVNVGGININASIPLVITAFVGIFKNVLVPGRVNRMLSPCGYVILATLIIGVVKVAISLNDGLEFIPVIGDFSRSYSYYFFAIWLIMSTGSVAEIVDRTRITFLWAPLLTLGIGLFIMVRYSLYTFFSQEIGVRFCTSSAGLLILFGAISMFVLYGNVKYAWWRLPLFFVYSFVALIANHRSVWLAALVTMIAYSILNAFGYVGKRNNTTRVLYPLIGVLGVISLLLVATTDIADTFVGRETGAAIRGRSLAFISPTDDANASFRSERWEYLLARVEDRWMFGLGLGEHSTMGADVGRYTLIAHNMYVDLYVRKGIISFIMYLALMVIFINNMHRTLIKSTDNSDTRVVAGFLVIACIAGHAFYVAYNDEYTVIYILLSGILLGTMFDHERRMRMLTRLR